MERKKKNIDRYRKIFRNRDIYKRKILWLKLLIKGISSESYTISNGTRSSSQVSSCQLGKTDVPDAKGHLVSDLCLAGDFFTFIFLA